MSLKTGTMLGPYEITGLLGAGGMGEVYRAKDTRLGRSVAIKVLPAGVAADRGRRQRFEQEARAVSALNHPHICTLHDVGSEGGTDYLVMEHLEGQSLAELLVKGPLPLQQVLQIGIQISDALAAAHRHGILHRDLKPGNVMVTKSGAKLLDFGLAKLKAPLVGGAAHTTALPTEPSPATGKGAILGTLAYMSPERLEGKDADTGADIWAFGCVLYEMATGKRAFEGESQASLIAAILKEAPRPMSGQQALAPPALERIVRRCLEKNPDERFQSARDLAFDLEEVGRSLEGTSGGREAAPEPRRTFKVAVPLVLLALGAGAVGIGFVAGRRAGSGQNPPTVRSATLRRFDLLLPDALPLAMVGNALLGMEQTAMALSPQGDRLAYITGTSTTTSLVLADLARGRFDPVPGTEGAFSPFFSPEGEWVGFLTTTQLKKVSAHGGSAVTLADIEEPLSATWIDADRILVMMDQGTRPTLVRASGGRIETPANGALAPASTTALRRFVPYSSPWTHALQCLDLEANRTFVLTNHGRVPLDAGAPQDAIYGFGPRLLPSGYLVYVLSDGTGTLVAVPIDPETLRPLAEPLEVAADVRYSAEYASAQVSTEAGMAVFAVTPYAGRYRLVRRSAEGSTEFLPFPPAGFGSFKISPDGSRLAVGIWPPNGSMELWIYDLVRGVRERLLSGGARSGMAWSADGQSLFVAPDPSPGERRALLKVHADGSGRVETIWSDVGALANMSADGRRLLLLDPGVTGRLWLFDAGSIPQHGVRLEVHGNTATIASFSPDSRWLAITSSEAGQSEVYVLRADRPQERVRVSSAGGEEPRWTPDGSHIVYRFGRRWYAAAFNPGTPPVIGAPVALFEGPYVNVPGYSHDVFPDGRHLLLEGSQEETTRRLHVITNLEAVLTSRGIPESW